MSSDKGDFAKDKVPLEEALNRAGFGLYSHILTSFAGVAIISFACIGYGSPILVPTSACELQTTATQQGLLAAAPVLGTILGTLAWGYLADTRGRRKMLLFALIGGATLNCLASLSVNWIMMLVLQFFAAISVSGLHSMAMSILSESVPMEKRNMVVLLVTSIFLLSQGIMALVAIPIIPLSYSYFIPALGIYWNSWRTLMLVYSVPALISAVWIYFMKESPKFVYANGDEDQALEILRTIHRVNHLRSNKELQVTGILKEDLTANQTENKNQIAQMFKAPFLKYTVIMSLLLVFQQVGAFLVWLPTIADQFVRIIESGDSSEQTLCDIIGSSIDDPIDTEVPCALNVTSLLFVLGVGASQSIINLLLSFLVNKVGRRNLAILIAAVCGTSGILVNLIPNTAGSVAVFAVMLMGIIVLGMYTAIIVALFPTHLRAIALALPLTFGRIGVVASIQVLNILLINNCEVGFYLFSSIFASSAIVASFLPDDRRLKSAPAPVKQDPEEEKIQTFDDISNNFATTGIYRNLEE